MTDTPTAARDFDPLREVVKLVKESPDDDGYSLLRALVAYHKKPHTALSFFDSCDSPDYMDRLEAILKADLPPAKGILTADGLLALRECQLIGRMAQASEECLAAGDADGAAQYCWSAASALVEVAARATVRAALRNTGDDLADMAAMIDDDDLGLG